MSGNAYKIAVQVCVEDAHIQEKCIKILKLPCDYLWPREEKYTLVIPIEPGDVLHLPAQATQIAARTAACAGASRRA